MKFVTYAQAIRSYPRIALLSNARVCLIEHKLLHTIARWPDNDTMRVDRILLIRMVKATNLAGNPVPDAGHSVPISSAYQSEFGHAHLPRVKVSFQPPKKRS